CKQKSKESTPEITATEHDKSKTHVPAPAQKEKKVPQKKAKQENRESNTTPSGKQQQQQKRDDVEGGAKPAQDASEARPKKQTPAQAMVEKISALLDSPGLSNRQRKQMIRQLEQAQATIQSQLLQNAAKATKAKVQAQAQQEKIANQLAMPGTKAGAGKEPTGGKTARPSATTVDSGGTSGGSASTGPVRNSLMEQLRRGIRAEGLDLPPGITLTRLDAIQAEALRLKRESIRKLSVPAKPAAAPPMDPSPAGMLSGSFGAGSPSNAGMFVVNPMSPIAMPGQDSVIMVNTGKLRGQEQPSPLPDAAPNGTDRKKRNKRRKNKGKEQDDQHSASIGAAGSGAADGGPRPTGNQSSEGSNIVTLRNPMFHGAPMAHGMGSGVGMHPPG
uniref:Uncharacterized protein n=1 Tax=Anopheles maculatus TaxID=74869 RepID=A0A182SJH8_9DIPT